MFITVCHLTLHDFLFYASREMGRLYETEKYLHNYGLTYALGMAKSPYSNLAQVPRYQEDLDGMNQQGVYVTPSHLALSKWPMRITIASCLRSVPIEWYSGDQKNWPPRVALNSLS